MKRRLVKLCLFLLAGALVNVAVAWATRKYSSSDVTFATVSWQRKLLYSESEIAAMTLKDAQAALLRVSRERKDAHPGDPRHERLRYEFQTITEQLRFLRGNTRRTGSLVGGWPVASLDCTAARSAFGVLTPVDGTFDVSIRGKSLVLPARLIPPGFAINTIFYAAILWLLLAAPGAMRRRLRRQRGQCLACAYPVGASATCTECGRALRAVGEMLP